MHRGLLFGAAALPLLLTGPGCRRSSSPSGAGAAATATGATEQAPALAPAGMSDPFVRLGRDAAKALDAGYAAMRARRYGEAREAFHRVVAAAPDYGVARWQEVRAAALGGQLADVPALWGELLARDDVAFAGRLAQDKDLAPLRATPQWAAIAAKIASLEATYKALYAKGLDQGFFFVARLRDASPVRFDGGGVARLEPHQEVFHYDPAARVYRRLTHTRGHAFAIDLSLDRKTLTFLAVTRAEQGQDKEVVLVEPEAGYVDLASLETVGPLPMKGRSPNVALYFNARGEPVWEGARAYTFDAARTTLVEVPSDALAATSNVTWASFSSVSHGDKKSAGARVSADGMAVELDGVARPLRAARPLSESTLEWSPDRKRLLYAGVLDPCAVIAAGKAAPAGAAARNELFLWDGEKQIASRIAQAVSAFDSLWLDTDHLVYEGGVGRKGTLHIYEVSTRTDTVLKPRLGAGLFGYPELVCEEPADLVDEPMDEGE